MAHENITARRKYVQQLIDQNVQFNQKILREIADKFQCHVSAIRADIVALSKDPRLPSLYPSAHTRKLIRKRDGKICQYCGSIDTDREFVVCHVVPVPEGPARPYNLVVACQPCNSKKGNTVWTPQNLDKITINNPEWRSKINALSTGNQPEFQLQDPEATLEAKQYYIRIYEAEEAEKIRIKIKKLLSQVENLTNENPSVLSDNSRQKVKEILEEIQSIE